ncbi:MAG: transposase [Ideonella sp.]|nr:transposase [Ideonella sp.]
MGLCPRRTRRHARCHLRLLHRPGAKFPAAFLAQWSGTLTCDDYSGYDAVHARDGCIEAGCLAHARRKFDDLVEASASPMAAQAILYFARIYQLRGPGARNGCWG